jgi:protein SCO1/2
MKTVISVLIALMLIGFSAQAQQGKCCSPSSTPTNEKTVQLPETSIYQLDHQWENQSGKSIQLADLQGNPVILTMIFTHCEYACPMMVNDLKQIESQFTDKHSKTKFVLISFDHERDTPERLRDYASVQGLGENWLLLHGNAEQIKEISLVLDISYEQLENGAFAHANKKFVLDQNGIILFEQEGLQTKADPVLKALNKLL